MKSIVDLLHHMSPERRTLALRLIAMAGLGLGLAVLADSFGSMNNLVTVLRQASLMFLLASGLSLVIIAGGLDLSIGANVSLSACLAGTVIAATGSSIAGVAVGAGCGTLIGIVNGWLIVGLRIPSFIATYGTMWILHGVTYWYMDGQTIHGMPSEFRMLGSGFFGGIPLPVYLMSLFLLAGTAFSQRTIWGQQIYAIGANPVAAKLSGIPVNHRMLLVYTMSGFMAGLASLVFLARLNSAEADLGEALTLQAIAAVLIGGTSLFGGRGTLAGTLLGSLILAIVLNGMNLLGISANWQPFITGVIVIVSVLFDSLGRRRRA